MNGKLVPFAVFALYALITFKGQEKPKQISIIVSKIELIGYSPFCFVCAYNIGRMIKRQFLEKKKNKMKEKSIFFTFESIFER